MNHEFPLLSAMASYSTLLSASICKENKGSRMNHEFPLLSAMASYSTLLSASICKENKGSRMNHEFPQGHRPHSRS
jgi:hypothetical protein